jgi:8-oxo-dGTP pyrophosphatase MutT (NUDIX family)
VRELAEELNISASPESLNCITPQPINDKLNYKYWLFEYRTDKEQKFSPDEKEILVAKYFDRNNLKNINLSDEALRALNLTI